MRVLDDFTNIEVGTPVLVLEAKDKDVFGSVELETLRWRIYPVDRDFILELYQDGLYKIVGVGVPFLKVGMGEYQVAVQDMVREYFSSNKIPF